jgi:hypothetical protein
MAPMTSLRTTSIAHALSVQHRACNTPTRAAPALTFLTTKSRAYGGTLARTVRSRPRVRAHARSAMSKGRSRPRAREPPPSGVPLDRARHGVDRACPLRRRRDGTTVGPSCRARAAGHYRRAAGVRTVAGKRGGAGRPAQLGRGREAIESDGKPPLHETRRRVRRRPTREQTGAPLRVGARMRRRLPGRLGL